ncbi:MAG: hypothetical protein KF773_26045 [Deltaproteobacteria bacterium]|nr:hypothetical protein [Deltaproteobacteria bacterium]
MVSPVVGNSIRSRDVVSGGCGGTSFAPRRAMRNEMSLIGQEQLAVVSGGMRWEGLPASTNVEDRRGLSLRESMRVRSPVVPPSPPVPRYPGDLPSQLGIDDIGRRRR